MNEFNPELIRRQTRLALPSEDGYLFRLGVALYGFASIASFMTEITCVLDTSISRISLMDKMAGDVLSAFRYAVRVSGKNWPEVKKLGHGTAERFETLNSMRSDIVHAYPITGKAGNQILHRRKDSQQKYFEVSEQFLDAFISDLQHVSVGLYAIRDIARKETEGHRSRY